MLSGFIYEIPITNDTTPYRIIIRADGDYPLQEVKIYLLYKGGGDSKEWNMAGHLIANSSLHDDLSTSRVKEK